MTTECLVKNMSNGITAVKHYKLMELVLEFISVNLTI